MKNLFTLLLLLAAVSASAQWHGYINPIKGLTWKQTKVQGDTAWYDLQPSQGLLDSLANAYNAGSKAAADNMVQAGDITGLKASVTDLYAKHKADSTAIANITVVSSGIPASITITGDMSIPATLGHNADIIMNCSRCTITLPIMPKGWKWKIHNIWKGTDGTVTITRVTGLSAAGISVSSIVRNSRPLDITYLSSTSVEIK